MNKETSLYLPFNPPSSGCTPPASLIQGGVGGDVLLPPVGAIGWVESVMATARQDAAFLGCTASAKGFRKGSKAFLKRYFKCISGLNAPDNPVSWGFQHILLGLTHFPFWFCRSPQNQLDSLEEQIILIEFSTSLFWFSTIMSNSFLVTSFLKKSVHRSKSN